MTAHDERIDRIEDRVDRLEKTLATDIRAILAKLSEMEVNMAKTACPAPGSCIKIGDKLESVMEAHNATMLRVERLEVHLMKLMQDRAYILGGTAVIGTAFSFIGVGLGMVFNWFLSKP